MTNRVTNQRMIQCHQRNHITALCQQTQRVRHRLHFVNIMPAKLRFAALWLLRFKLLFQHLAQLLIKRIAGRQQDKTHANCCCGKG